MKVRGLGIGIVLLASGVCHAQSLQTKLFTESEARLYRDQAGDTDKVEDADKKAALRPWQGSIGAGYTDYDAGASAWNVPVALRHTWTKIPLTVGFQSSGFTRARQPGTSGLEGWSENRVYANYVLMKTAAESTLTIGLGLKIPAKGETDSQNYQQSISVDYAGKVDLKSFGVWVPTFNLVMRRSTGTTTEGAARAYYGSLGLGRKVGSHTIALTVERLVTKETDKATNAVLSYKFPLRDIKENATAIKISGTRDFTDGASYSSLQLVVLQDF